MVTQTELAGSGVTPFPPREELTAARTFGVTSWL